MNSNPPSIKFMISELTKEIYTGLISKRGLPESEEMRDEWWNASKEQAEFIINKTYSNSVETA